MIPIHTSLTVVRNTASVDPKLESPLPIEPPGTMPSPGPVLSFEGPPVEAPGPVEEGFTITPSPVEEEEVLFELSVQFELSVLLSLQSPTPVLLLLLELLLSCARAVGLLNTSSRSNATSATNWIHAESLWRFRLPERLLFAMIRPLS
jgi:hypothetical protein